MSYQILAHRGRLIADENRRWSTLGATWMREFTRTLTEAERDALAQALAFLLARSDLADCAPGGLDR